MNRRVLFWSLTSALAGFLFGFDTVVISGAEKTIQSLWGLSPGLHGIAMALPSTAPSWVHSSAAGPLTASVAKPRFYGSAFFTLLVQSVPGYTNVYLFIVARVIGGLGIGISTVVAPLYISEISPPTYRGRLAGMFQFNIVFGIIVAFLSNYLLKDVGANAWRWMLGVAAFPSLIYTVSCLGLPESPRWLRPQGRSRGGAESSTAHRT